MAAIASPPLPTVVPAQLGFLAIYNPSLGTTDETLDDQIVYYASVNTQTKKRRHRSRGKPIDSISQEERNERLRQIGLAQGMVEFSRGFSDDKPLDTIETEKSRVVLHELEPGWWILASVDLTKLPLPPRLGAPVPNQKDNTSENVEYSSRELKPAALLMQDLLRAHSIFLLHHAASLSALFVRSKRSKFISILSRYWDLFLSTWDVMLHGNPATSLFGGIKIAACGELGVGVGEEERGSGEREVLEGFVDRVEGLIDLIVCKFGSSESAVGEDSSKDPKLTDGPTKKWLGTGEEPGAEDGAIFLGVGSLTRKSLRDVTYWMEDLYTWGEDAYGVRESPASIRQARKSKKRTSPSSNDAVRGSVKIPEANDPNNSKQPSTQDQPTDPQDLENAPPKNAEDATEESGVNKFMSYLKMGYGTHWTLGNAGGSEETVQEETIPIESSKKDEIPPNNSHRSKKVSGDSGHYLIGLRGDVEETSTVEHAENREQSDTPPEEVGYNSRVLLRTLIVELENTKRPEAEMTRDFGSQDNELASHKNAQGPVSHFDSQDRNKTHKVRVVVYVNKPFVYTFLFQNRTDSLAWEGLYRSLHYQLAPLRKPLATSTAYRPGRPDIGAVGPHIFDLIWDPEAMTVHSTIPSIPTPGHMLQENAQPVWSRVEAINTHHQILNTYITTSTDPSELERTCKTSRGWWIVWTRIIGKDGIQSSSSSLPPDPSDISIPHSESAESVDSQSRPKRGKVGKEIFLIRRAGEHTRLRGLSSSYAEGGGGWTDGASRLAQGIGVDTKKYIEGLLSLGR
ncbi:uncharacterized protein GGS22DRAFT_55435 [Annulohypoxylon maeteangense]|uniref:uncharacterized protein n=1 Tax=Annulohypoxylon maeteangense TaxID=1927788 RepID=UPI002008E3E5|nr:uncharacterized protein GGS22DRAFT_55435 [Annulohypoxylon maeteangense]KAI0881724.1 hypothetical protein GGS22DRAFT_55435 [Annulohypoxylon maeteangense]